MLQDVFNHMSTTQELIIVSEAELDKNLAESKLAVESVQSLKAAFQPHFTAFTKLATAAQAIPEDSPKAARAMRLELRKIRLAAEKTRKELKEDSLLRSRAVDGVNNLLLYALKPIEDHLENIEKKEEIEAQKRLDALRQIRLQELTKYTEAPAYDVGTMSEDQFQATLLGFKTAYENKLKAEAERIEAEKKAQEEAAKERERLRLENERLAKVAAEAEKARKEAEAKAAKEKAERDAEEKARLAKEQAEKKRLADEAAAKQKAIEEKARKEREAIEAKARTEREAAQKKADEERKKREALEAEIKKREKEEADRKAAQLAEQEKLAAAPDKQKLLALAETIKNLQLPVLTSKKGKVLSVTLTQQVSKFSSWVEAEANKL